MKILIIDDSADALAVAKARLAHEGHDILCAGGGKEGLETAGRNCVRTAESPTPAGRPARQGESPAET